MHPNLKLELDAWARYYDFIHLGLPGEAEFYVMEALRRGGATLELGCGTGRVCIPMAMSGVDATGLDFSQKMLAVCRAKARAVRPLKGTLTLAHADMRHFDLGRKFSLIVIPYRGFMHLLGPEDQRRCLQCVRSHLAPDGLLLLNVWAAKPTTLAHAIRMYDSEEPWFSESIPLDEEGVVLNHYHAAHYDEFEQRILEQHRMDTVDAEGRLLETQRLTLTRTWFTPREMEHLVVSCGFAIEAVWGDFDGEALGEDSNEMIWFLRPAR
jgi:SAM-dependent methyltransferase